MNDEEDEEKYWANVAAEEKRCVQSGEKARKLFIKTALPNCLLPSLPSPLPSLPP